MKQRKRILGLVGVILVVGLVLGYWISNKQVTPEWDWRQVSGPPATLNSATTTTLTLTAPENGPSGLMDFEISSVTRTETASVEFNGAPQHRLEFRPTEAPEGQPDRVEARYYRKDGMSVVASKAISIEYTVTLQNREVLVIRDTMVVALGAILEFQSSTSLGMNNAGQPIDLSQVVDLKATIREGGVQVGVENPLPMPNVRSTIELR